MTEDAMPRRVIPWFSAATGEDWDELYTAQLPRVYNYFRYRLGDVADVEDLTATTFEKAWRGRHRFRRDLGAFSTWLFSIARNVAVDHFRSARRREGPLEDAATLVAGRTPEDDLVARSNVARLTAVMAALDERDRELVALKYGAGLTNRTIARVTGLTESNVGTVLHRAVGKLRAEWA